MILASEIPTIEELFDWDGVLLKGTPFEINRVVLLMFLATIVTLALFFVAFGKPRLVPKGLQNIMESLVDFVRTNIILQVIGPEGLRYLPFLGTMFIWLAVLNLFEVIPGIQFPVTSRMAIPAFLAIAVWFIMNIQGIVKRGWGYYAGVLFPPGVPIAVKPLLAVIELFSTFLLRPFTLAVRLFANMVAGHVLLTIFFVFCESFFVLGPGLAVWVPSFIMSIALVGFEIFVALIQAFIFTILTAVYVGEAIHGH